MFCYQAYLKIEQNIRFKKWNWILEVGKFNFKILWQLWICSHKKFKENFFLSYFIPIVS